ncbi:unnamed protein product, partial [Larinioides sclopetarius]
LTLKSTKTDKQSHVTISLPADSRAHLQSEVSRGTEEQSMNSTTFLTDTTYDQPYIGLPRHNSTPRKRWAVTPRDEQDGILIATETVELSALD